jgi:hypothetical protein
MLALLVEVWADQSEGRGESVDVVQLRCVAPFSDRQSRRNLGQYAKAKVVSSWFCRPVHLADSSVSIPQGKGVISAVRTSSTESAPAPQFPIRKGPSVYIIVVMRSRTHETFIVHQPQPAENNRRLKRRALRSAPAQARSQRPMKHEGMKR